MRCVHSFKYFLYVFLFYMAVVVRKTVGRGKGVFALRNFVEGAQVAVIAGKVVSDVDALRMSRHALNHMSAVSLHDWILVDSPVKFINHSCDPNVFERDGVVYAMKGVCSGGELLFDYSLNGVPNVDDWKMICKCGSPECRKIVHGEFFRLPSVLQKKYLPFLDSWFLKEFESELRDI